MMRYKVGDKVHIRKDLKIGENYGTCFITPNMHNLCGEIVRITEVDEDYRAYHVSPGGTCWWTDEMLEDVNMEGQEMHKSVIINVVENKVIAYCDSKIGIARCHPDDTFDFFVGAKIALERLEEAEKPYAWLKDGVRYYVPDVTASDLYGTQTYSADKWDKRYMERGIAFQTREEAVACAKKMLAAIKPEG